MILFLQNLDTTFSVGRLDFASEGLLLLSDSPGKLVSALMHSDLERVYYVKINGLVTQAMEKAMQEGLSLEDAQRDWTRKK